MWKELNIDRDRTKVAFRMLPESHYAVGTMSSSSDLLDEDLEGQTLSFFVTDFTAIVRDIKIYNFPRNREIYTEAHYTPDGTDHASCNDIGNQGGCDVCLKSDPNCFSKCSYNEYGEDCEPCHPFCETCSGPLLADCLTCTADAALNVIESPVHGNCTCIDGMYHRTSDDTCQPCNGNCEKCYEASYTDCLTCTTGYYLVPGTDECRGDCSNIDDPAN